MRPEESFLEQPIRSLQTMLRVISEDDARFPSVIPDGIYGPATMNAITVFQRLYELPVTGITDQITWEKIVAAYICGFFCIYGTWHFRSILLSGIIG